MEKVRYLREILGMGVREFARNFRLTPSTVSRLQRGQMTIGPKYKAIFGHYFGIRQTWWEEKRPTFPWADIPDDYRSHTAGQIWEKLNSAGRIKNRCEALFLAELIQHAWSMSDKATSLFVRNVANAIKLLLMQVIRNIDELHPYLEITLPQGNGHGITIKERPAHIIESLTGTVVDNDLADKTARCLVLLLRDGDFEMPDDVFSKISNYLIEDAGWGFWVAKRGLKGKIEYFDPTPLLDIPKPEKDYYSYPIERKAVFAKVNYGSNNCNFTFNFFDKSMEISCSAKGFLHLKEEEGGLLVTHQDTHVSIGDKEAIEDFRSILAEIWADPRASWFITHELTEKFGAV